MGIEQNLYKWWNDNDLVAIASFGKSRFKDGEYELYRYVQKSGTVVIGGLKRLCTAYMKSNNIHRIITYCDLTLFNGNGYTKSGFTYLRDTPPNYFYFQPSKIELHSRIKFQKHKLNKLLTNFDSSLTEVENMHANGWLRIFDCGNKLFELTI